MDGRLFVGVEISTQQVFVKFLLNSAMTSSTLCTGCYPDFCWLTPCYAHKSSFPPYVMLLVISSLRYAADRTSIPVTLPVLSYHKLSQGKLTPPVLGHFVLHTR